MANARIPGIQCALPRGDINDGTLARTLSPLPGLISDKSRKAKPESAPRTSANTQKRKLTFESMVYRTGSRGEGVKSLQRRLNAKSANASTLNIDGIFAQQTFNAVVDFQRRQGISADGVVGKDTWFHLLNDVPVSGKGSTSPITSMPGTAPEANTVNNLGDWELEAKFSAVLKRTAQRLPSSMRDEFLALLSEDNLKFMAAVLVVWAGSHAFGVGQAVDIILLVGGIAMLGVAAFEVGREIGDFLVMTAGATSEAELDAGADHLAKAISVLGVAAFMALLAKVGRGKGVKKSAPRNAATEVQPSSKSPLSGKGRANPSVVEPKVNVATPNSAPSFLKKPLHKHKLEPGAVRGKRKVTINKMPEPVKGFPEIKQSEVNTFSSTPVAETIPEGTKLYRVVGDGSNPAGSYWTRNLPTSEAQWRSDAAVMGKWNGNGGYVEYTVPKGGLPAWTGKAARQPAGRKGYVLEGGGDQVFIAPNAVTPSPVKQSPWLKP